ncbi:MAG: alpha/beta hydrolase [Gammaproteobacteria bacterium]|nr:MAG: alpha/beta hydrolase [Gammaproteobacteria bacterium]
MLMMKTFIFRSLFIVGVIVASIVLVRAFDSRRLPELQPWHKISLDSEFTESKSDQIESLGDYLELEERVFQEMDTSIYKDAEPESQFVFSRYTPNSPVDPEQFSPNWNRTFELIPENVKGGVLMIHGLTDSPYSMRHLARVFEEQGYYVLAMRMPGHGTIPSGLLTARWEDWMAATYLGARHVHEKIGKDLPFFVVGYSNGGALTVKYIMESLQDETKPMPDRVILMSPMLGVTFFARFSSWHKILSWLPYFEKFKWLDVLPEFDPYKYNSFTKAAGEQSYQLTNAIHKQVGQLVKSRSISGLPSITTFQSLVDATVLTSSIIDVLYSKLSPNKHELVLFDVNRVTANKSFFYVEHHDLLLDLRDTMGLPFDVTLITNKNDKSRDMVFKYKKMDSQEITTQALDLSWPSGVYSLSHVAIPFSPDDLLYGPVGPDESENHVNLGAFAPRGERRILVIPTELLMRLRYNPFFEYMERKIVDIINE